MALSVDTAKRLALALGSKGAGNELADAVNGGQAQANQDVFVIPAVITATSTSTTVDFTGILKISDIVVHIPAVAGNTVFWSVVSAGTLPSAAVVGDLYIVLRAYSPPASSSIVF